MNERIEARKALYESKPIERRLRPFEVRTFVDGAASAGSDPVECLGLTGYASTIDQPYPVTDWLGEYQETICRGAFTKALQESQDVRLLLNHDGVPLARTSSGTMRLSEDDHGLLVDVPSLDTESPLVQTIRSAMKRGDLDQMSFAFRATRQEWNEDYTERFVREVKLYDVSVVTYPANDGTSVKLRGGLPFGCLDRLAMGADLTDEDVRALQGVILRVSDAKWNPHEGDYTIEQWRHACLYHPATASESKSDYKLPVREPGGEVNRNGAHAAASRINQVDGDKAQITKAAKKLVSIYRNDLNEDPPDSLVKLANRGAAEAAERRLAQLRAIAASL